MLSLLIHLGYLGFDDERREVFIPNREILDEFRTSTKTEEWTEPFRAYSREKEGMPCLFYSRLDREEKGKMEGTEEAGI